MRISGELHLFDVNMNATLAAHLPGTPIRNAEDEIIGKICGVEITEDKVIAEMEVTDHDVSLALQKCLRIRTEDISCSKS